jgi:hypothetical protein
MRWKSASLKASRSAWGANLVVPALLTRMSTAPKAVHGGADCRLGCPRFRLARGEIHHDIGAFAAEPLRNGGADSGRRTCDNRGLAFEVCLVHDHPRIPACRLCASDAP